MEELQQLNKQEIKNLCIKKKVNYRYSGKQKIFFLRGFAPACCEVQRIIQSQSEFNAVGQD